MLPYAHQALLTRVLGTFTFDNRTASRRCAVGTSSRGAAVMRYAATTMTSYDFLVLRDYSQFSQWVCACCGLYTSILPRRAARMGIAYVPTLRFMTLLNNGCDVSPTRPRFDAMPQRL